MAKYRIAGNAVLLVTDVNGTSRDMSNYVDTIEGPGRSFDNLDVTGFSNASEQFIRGIEKAPQITMRGAFDDTGTTGPDAVFAGLAGGTGTGTLTWNPVGTASGARKITLLFLHGGNYKVGGEVKGRAQYEYQVQQTGASTLGTN